MPAQYKAGAKRYSNIPPGLVPTIVGELANRVIACRLFNSFFKHCRYSSSLVSSLIDTARGCRGEPWEIRRLAVLMLENQMLRLGKSDTERIIELLLMLGLIRADDPAHKVRETLQSEGYTTNDPEPFFYELKERLRRLYRIHARIRGKHTAREALRDFIHISRRECRLTLARFLITPDEVTDQINARMIKSRAIANEIISLPWYVRREAARSLAKMPDFEASIFSAITQGSEIYWVSDSIGSELNSLIEYPLTTVVLVVKPPGSDLEFEIKKTGRRGSRPIGVVYLRDGRRVPPDHRLDGGAWGPSPRWEAKSSSRLAIIYRLVHGEEAPVPTTHSLASIYSVPTEGGETDILSYFTDPAAFGEGFDQMRSAMASAVETFCNENAQEPLPLTGDLGLTVKFLNWVAPSQSVLCGTSSFRLDRTADYLSPGGADLYFKSGLGRDPNESEARQFADELLDEVLGVYLPPRTRYRNHEQHLAAAFAVPENRLQADSNYVTLMEQAGRFWGTLLALRGFSWGESVVARNVGIRSVWRDGRWQVRLVFMDHDSLVIPDVRSSEFAALTAMAGTREDESYLMGEATKEWMLRGSVDCLESIYRIDRRLKVQGRNQLRRALRTAYCKTQERMIKDPRLWRFFNRLFLERLKDWDEMVRSRLAADGNASATARWKRKTSRLLSSKGYSDKRIEDHFNAVERYGSLLKKYAFLFSD